VSLLYDIARDVLVPLGSLAVGWITHKRSASEKRAKDAAEANKKAARSEAFVRAVDGANSAVLAYLKLGQLKPQPAAVIAKWSQLFVTFASKSGNKPTREELTRAVGKGLRFLLAQLDNEATLPGLKIKPNDLAQILAAFEVAILASDFGRDIPGLGDLL
jgi:hypothetical protein